MSDVPEPVARALAAANANDTEAFLACFTRDGVVDDWGREFRGADEIRAWSDREFIGCASRSTSPASKRGTAPRR